jgi:putative hydrolase of the HAD superfamily
MDERLITLIREAAVPVEPLLPALPPEWEELTPFAGAYRAVLFDVYGTLFCSAAGDIAARKYRSELPESRTEKAGNQALDDLAALYGLSGKDLQAWFQQKVREIHEQKRAQTAWPEVRVEQIWADFLAEREGVLAERWERCGVLEERREVSGAEERGRELALRYALAANPVYPMPGALQTISALKASGCVLGIISNAQFFTPLLFEAFWGAPPEKSGFDPQLLFYSHERGEAKPAPGLFAAAARRLAGKGIDPANCAFVGNDMLSDIYGSMKAGFQGVLFAGDSRSLRLREGNELVGSLRPSRIIRSLTELVPSLNTLPPPMIVKS